VVPFLGKIPCVVVPCARNCFFLPSSFLHHKRAAGTCSSSSRVNPFVPQRECTKKCRRTAAPASVVVTLEVVGYLWSLANTDFLLHLSRSEMLFFFFPRLHLCLADVKQRLREHELVLLALLFLFAWLFWTSLFFFFPFLVSLLLLPWGMLMLVLGSGLVWSSCQGLAAAE